MQGTNDTSTRFYSMITSDSSMYAYLTINNATEGGGSTFESRNYHTFQDQITLAGEVYTDAMYNSLTSGNKRVIALNTIPIENHLASGTNDDFFYPSFFPSGMYSSASMDFKSLGPDYCAAVGNNTSTCNTYANNYDWAEQLLDVNQTIYTSRFDASSSEMPEGTSQWYQVLNPAGKGVGLQAQLSIQDSYDGAGGSTTRDDQQSYLGVMISSLDKRSNDLTRYNAGDTGQQLEGNHYWSYQKRTNATNDGLGVQLGSTPIECATSSDMGCFLGRDNSTDNRPMALMATSSDPYKNGDMTLGVKYDTNSDSWATDTINQMVVSNAISGRLSDVRSGVRFDRGGGFGHYLLANENCADNTCAIHSLEAGDAFAVSTLFYLPDSEGSNVTHPLWGTRWSNQNGNSDSGEVYMRIENNQIRFGGGRMSSNYIKFNGSDTLTEGKWYGLYLTYDGGTLTHYDEFGCCMTIKLVDPYTGVVTTAAGSDSHSNNPDHWFTGSANKRYYIGNYGSYQNNSDDQLIISNNIMTTLQVGQPQSDEEIVMMLTKPEQWVADYKIGKTARLSESSGTFTFALGDSNSAKATQVFRLGKEYGKDLRYWNGDMSSFNYIDPPTWTDQGVWSYPNFNTTSSIYVNSASGLQPNSVYQGTAGDEHHDHNQLVICCKEYDSKSISDFRHTDFYSSTATTYYGYFNGLMEFDVSGTGNDQLASIRSNGTLTSINFDTTNDDVQVAAPLTVSKLPGNNYTNTWDKVDEGELVLNFGDADNSNAKSAYLSNEVFAAEIQDNGAQIDGSSGSTNNLAGVMVSYNTLDKEDSDLFHTNGNDPMPNTEYSTWGFWAMGAVDVSPNSGNQTAAVHLGTWVAGELTANNAIPTSGSANMSGAAVVKAAYRHNSSDNTYDVHKYTTTADVAATFNWGSSAYTGTLAFTNFDDKNPIVANAGFTSFNVSLNSSNGITSRYTGASTTTIQNGWSGGATVEGALYRSIHPDESGGRINVSLYKNGPLNSQGANDFYVAEGIYLVD